MGGYPQAAALVHARPAYSDALKEILILVHLKKFIGDLKGFFIQVKKSGKPLASGYT